ncbi:MAG: hypothetical protein COA38_11000 [Fluviicola sp.]|nr:MAG: hypothetical protein COA38_11000 [Fluviicola sp.]
MNDEFFIWAAKTESSAAVLVRMKGFEKYYELDLGIAQSDSFPNGVTLHMDSRNPANTLLVDNVKNTEGVTIISEKMKLFIEKQKLIDIEFLPITVIDHEGRNLDDHYYIFHPINNVDCLDLDNVDPEWDDIDENVVASVKQLMIDGAKLPVNKEFFRPKNYIARPIVAKGLVTAILSEGFTGIQFLPVSEISGYLR